MKVKYATRAYGLHILERRVSTEGRSCRPKKSGNGYESTYRSKLQGCNSNASDRSVNSVQTDESTTVAMRENRILHGDVFEIGPSLGDDSL